MTLPALNLRPKNLFRFGRELWPSLRRILCLTLFTLACVNGFLYISLLVFEEIAFATERPEMPCFMDADLENNRHRKIQTSLERIREAAGLPQTKPTLYIIELPELNAHFASDGSYCFTEGVADLPEWAVDGMAAHEVAHELLNHLDESYEIWLRCEVAAEILVTLALTPQPGAYIVGEGIYRIVMSDINKNQELAADDKAVELLETYGYHHPSRIRRRTLMLLYEKYGDSFPGFFDTHPSLAFRIRRLLAPAPIQKASDS